MPIWTSAMLVTWWTRASTPRWNRHRGGLDAGTMDVAGRWTLQWWKLKVWNSPIGKDKRSLHGFSPGCTHLASSYHAEFYCQCNPGCKRFGNLWRIWETLKFIWSARPCCELRPVWQAWRLNCKLLMIGSGRQKGTDIPKLLLLQSQCSPSACVHIFKSKSTPTFITPLRRWLTRDNHHLHLVPEELLWRLWNTMLVPEQTIASTWWPSSPTSASCSAPRVAPDSVSAAVSERPRHCVPPNQPTSVQASLPQLEGAYPWNTVVSSILEPRGGCRQIFYNILYISIIKGSLDEKLPIYEQDPKSKRLDSFEKRFVRD